MKIRFPPQLRFDLKRLTGLNTAQRLPAALRTLFHGPDRDGDNRHRRTALVVRYPEVL